jgi:hypothetical protein
MAYCPPEMHAAATTEAFGDIVAVRVGGRA